MNLRDKLLASTLANYKTPRERTALRCALGDAAALLDGIAKDAADKHKTRGGYIKKRGQEDQRLIIEAANAVWDMREKITNDATPPSTERQAG